MAGPVISTCSYPLNAVDRQSSSEGNTNTSIDIAAVEWSPRIDRPATVRRPRRSYQRVVARLTDIAEVLAVCEEFDLPEGYLAEEPEKHVAAAARAVRIVIKWLPADVRDLDSDPTP
jgi:hypothetical protein